MNCYVKYNNQILGPFTEGQVINLLQQGRFDDSVSFSNDMATWRPAREVSPFKDIPLRPAPVSPQNYVPPQSNETHKSHALAFFGAFCVVAFLAFAAGVIAILKDDIMPPKEAVVEKNIANSPQKSSTSPESRVESQSSIEDTLPDVYERKKRAVALVTITVEMKECDPMTFDVGTAFAISNNKFVTNAHVARAVQNVSKYYDSVLEEILFYYLKDLANKEGMTLDGYKKKIGERGVVRHRNELIGYLKQNGLKFRNVEVRLSSSNGRRFMLKNIQVHPDYNENDQQNGEYDVAIFEIDGNTDCYFEIATKTELLALKTGTRVASAGFPTEGLYDTNIAKPEATYATGDIKKMTDFEYKDAGPEYNRNITHSIPGAGGASGSPMFTASGKVVAVIWGVSNFGNYGRGRIVNATLQNFAVRIDQLENVRTSKSYTLEEWINDPLK